MKTEIHNAQIKSTMLGYEDHGILTAMLDVEWAGGGIGFGGYRLDSPKGDDTELQGVSIDYIKEIMRVVGVSRWEDLQGKYIRIETEGWGGRALAIGNLMSDEWFRPKEWFALQLKRIGRGPGV